MIIEESSSVWNLRSTNVMILLVSSMSAAIASASCVGVLRVEGTVVHPSYVLNGDSAAATLGASVCALDDLTGDGVAELVVGAPSEGAQHLSPGYIQIVSGSNGSEITRISIGEKGSRFGWSLCGLSDIDGDGHRDFAVGAPGPSWSTLPPIKGSVYLLSGVDGSVIRVVHGKSKGSLFGDSVASLGDVDSDGVGDLGVLAVHEDLGGQRLGVAYAISGKNGSVIYEVSGDPEEQLISPLVSFGQGSQDVKDLVVPEGRQGGLRAYSGRNGSRLWSATDVTSWARLSPSESSYDHDRDGHSDILVCYLEWDITKKVGLFRVLSGKTGAQLVKLDEAPQAAVAVGGSAGENARYAVLVFYGRAELYELPSLRKVDTISVPAWEEVRAFGVADLNGDGQRDFVLTAPYDPGVDGEAATGGKTGRQGTGDASNAAATIKKESRGTVLVFFTKK